MFQRLQCLVTLRNHEKEKKGIESMKEMVDVQSLESTNNGCVMIAAVKWVVGKKTSLSSCLSPVVF